MSARAAGAPKAAARKPATRKPATRLNINPGRFAFLANFASTEDTRFYLNGVYIEPHPAGGVVMVATDGHVMGVAHDPDGSCDAPAIISTQRKPAAIFLPPAPIRDRCRLELTRSAELGGDRYLATRTGPTPKASGAVGIVEVIDGVFPPWRGVVPWALMADPTPMLAGTFNGQLLSRFAAPYAHCDAALELRQRAAGDAALVIRDELPWFVGVIMPMHRSGGLGAGILALAPKGEEAAA